MNTLNYGVVDEESDDAGAGAGAEDESELAGAVEPESVVGVDVVEEEFVLAGVDVVEEESTLAGADEVVEVVSVDVVVGVSGVDGVELVSGADEVVGAESVLAGVDEVTGVVSVDVVVGADDSDGVELVSGVVEVVGVVDIVGVDEVVGVVETGVVTGVVVVVGVGTAEGVGVTVPTTHSPTTDFIEPPDMRIQYGAPVTSSYRVIPVGFVAVPTVSFVVTTATKFAADAVISAPRALNSPSMSATVDEAVRAGVDVAVNAVDSSFERRTSIASVFFCNSCTPRRVNETSLYISTPLPLAERISLGASSAIRPR